MSDFLGFAYGAVTIKSRQLLASYIPGIQTSRHGGVRRPLDDCPAVGKQSHFVRLVPEFQNEIVVPYGSVWLQPLGHFG